MAYKVGALLDDLNGLVGGLQHTPLADVEEWEIQIVLAGDEFIDGDVLALDGEVALAADPKERAVRIFATSIRDSE